MRLIDADKLKKDMLIQNILGEPMQKIVNRYIHIVDSQPTAFDLDKVVEQLEKLKNTEQDDSVAEIVSTRIWNKAIQSAVSIVKGGGIK